MEDVLDVIGTLFGNKYSILLFFDHSCDHDRAHPDSLSTTNMNIFYGGKQITPHDSVIKSSSSFLGQFHYPNHECTQLSVGDSQSFIFKDTDTGPFWMTHEERITHRNDHHTGNFRKRKKTGAELKDDLEQVLGYKIKKKVAEMKVMAVEHNISLDITTEIVNKGWLGQP